MQDLVIDLQTKLQRINKAIDTLARNGQAKAKAEMEYRIALRQEILLEREKGTPVTIINDVCRGNSKIASLKFARDTAEVVYDANMEAIMVWKMEAKMIDSQIAREWGRND